MNRDKLTPSPSPSPSPSPGAMIVYDAKDLVPVVEARAQPTVLVARESSTLIEGRAAAVDQFN